jgi:hypothetical protein
VRIGGYWRDMTTTPNEPVQDPDYAPGGPDEDPTVDPEPEPAQGELRS